MSTRFSGPSTGEWQTEQLISKKVFPRVASPVGICCALAVADARAAATNSLGAIVSDLRGNTVCMITIPGLVRDICVEKIAKAQNRASAPRAFRLKNLLVQISEML